MAEKKFSKKEAIKFGWQAMKQNIGFFIGLLIAALLISIVPDVAADFLEEENPLLAFIVGAIGAALNIIVVLGLTKISLNFCDNSRSKISDIFSQYRLFFRFLFASILYGLIVIAGLILLIIPGIYLVLRLQFYRYFIVDKGSGITESLKRSWAITEGSAWNLFLFSLLLGLINLAGALLFLVGLFATVPTTMVAAAFVYRKLLAHAEVALTVRAQQAPQEIPQAPQEFQAPQTNIYPNP